MPITVEQRAGDAVDEPAPVRPRGSLFDPWAIAVVSTGISAAWACRPANLQLPGEVALDAETPIPVRDDGGTDTTPPGVVGISSVALDLGAPGPCGQLESLSFLVEGAERSRVVAAFGEKSELASTAPFALLFEPPESGEVSIYLGSDKARSGSGFSREKLCFALAAVDDAGNVGPRSSPWCLNTVSGDVTNDSVEARPSFRFGKLRL